MHALLWLLAAWPYAVVALVLVATVAARLKLGHWPDGNGPFGHWYLRGVPHRATHWATLALIWLAPAQYLLYVLALVHHCVTTRRRERAFAWLVIASAVGWVMCVAAVGLTGFTHLAFD